MQPPRRKNHFPCAAPALLAAPVLWCSVSSAHADENRISPFAAVGGQAPDTSSLGLLRSDRKLFNWPATESVLKQPTDLKSAMDALATASPLIGQLRQWRSSMRGQGQVMAFGIGGSGFAVLKDPNAATNALRIGVRPMGQYSLAGLNSFGQQTPGIEVTWKNFSFGMTQPLAMINRAMSPVDSVLEGKQNIAANPINESSLMWMTMKPISGKSGNLEMMMVKGSRDLSPWSNEGKTFASGELWGAKGDMKLGARWNMAAEWMNSRSDAQSGDSAVAWKMTMNGPIKHPLGETRVNFNMNSTAANFAPFTGNNSNAGQTQTHLDLQQGIAKGKLGGNLTFAYDKTNLPANQAGIALTTGINATDGVERTTQDANADFHLALSPKMSMTARVHHRKGALNATNLNIAATTGNENTADFGMNWKFNKSMNFALTAGRSALQNTTFYQSEYSQLDRTENRLNATLTRATRGGSWGLTWSQNTAIGNLGGVTDAQRTSLSLEASRTLTQWLRVRGTMRLASSRDAASLLGNDAADHNFEAYFTFPRYGNFSFRFSDWNLDGGTFSNYGQQTATKEQSFRYQTPGSSRLGVTVEYLMREQINGQADNQLKIGMTIAKQ